MIILEISNLTSLDILQGSFSMVYVVISYILGISILLKYFKFKSKDYIFVGIAWIGLSNPWLPDAISFLMIIFLKVSLTPEASFIIGYSIIPFFLFCWLIAITDLLYKVYQKLILASYLILVLIFEITFFSLLLTDSSLIGTFIGPFRIRWTQYMEFLLFILILIILISGILFAQTSIRSHSPEVSLKGKFILLAFISFTIAAFIEAQFHLDPILVVITRSILISSSIEFYIGFILPKRIKFLILKME